MKMFVRVLIFVCTLGLVTGVQPFSTSPAYAGYKKIHINVKGMKNYASTLEVKEALNKVKGVKRAYVDFRNERVVVTVKKGVDPDVLINAIKKVGFRAYLAEKAGLGKKKEEHPYEEFQEEY